MSAAGPPPTDPPAPPSPGTGPRSPDGTWRAVLATLTGLAVVVALGVGLIASTGGHTVDAHSHRTATGATSVMVAPDGVLDLASVPQTIAAEFRYAADQPEAYGQLRCWCGCEAAFAHDSLLDCFVRADGGWEAHGAGCAVCIAEATTARARLHDGVPVAEIAAELDAEYGPASLPAIDPSKEPQP